MAMPDGVAIWWIQVERVKDDPHPEFTEAALSWISSLGLDPRRLAPYAAVARWNGGYELHVDEIVADDSPSLAGDRFDPIGADSLLTVRRIIPVEKDSWPAMSPIDQLAPWPGKSALLAV